MTTEEKKTLVEKYESLQKENDRLKTDLENYKALCRQYEKTIETSIELLRAHRQHLELSKALETPVEKLARHGELAEDEANKANN